MIFFVQSRERVITRVRELSNRGLDLVGFWSECTEVITPVMPHYLGPCWFTVDPASLMITSHYQEGLPEIPSEWLAEEYYGDDFNKMVDVARSESGVGTLLEATGGDPTLSARYHEQMVPFGCDQEMLVGLRTTRDEIWGCLGLYREMGQPQFGPDDFSFVRELSPHLAEGARRALLFAEATDPDDPEPPGLVVIDDNWEVESVTPAAARWLADFPDGDWGRGILPSAVSSVAGQARRTAERDDPGQVAYARVLSRSGRWIVLHGASLVSGDRPRVAVIIELAHPARIAPLLMAAYGLSEREQDVTRLVLQGCSTTEIADRLYISVNTVQQHLKSIFEKTSVRSRRDLVGKVFFAHYEPRVRDNEGRAVAGDPLRGGPSPMA